MPPPKMKAIVTCGEPGKVELREINVPALGPGEVLIKVAAAAANPTDWKMATWVPTTGNVVGLDFTGTVEELGPEVPAGRLKVGDRVAGAVHGGAYPNGAFAEYVVASASLLLPLPDTWSFEQGAQIPTAGATACLCLYHSLSLPSPLSPAKSEHIDLLIWGGSSSVGQFVIQLAHLSGLRVIATSSPHNFPLLKSFGADLVFSHADPETPKKIREATGGKLKYAVDCISDPDKSTPEKIARSIGDEGGEVIIISGPYESQRPDVKVRPVLAYHLFGKDIEIPLKQPLDISVYNFVPELGKILTESLANGSLKPGPIKIFPRGLASVTDGLNYLKEGKVSGEKVVFRIADTPA